MGSFSEINLVQVTWGTASHRPHWTRPLPIHSARVFVLSSPCTCRWPSPGFLLQRASSFFPQTPRCEGWVPQAKLARVLVPRSSPPILGEARAGEADGGNWWWVFGDGIKIHRGGRGGGTCSERYTAAHLDHECAVIDEGSHQSWKCSGKAAVSVPPEWCLSKETAL